MKSLLPAPLAALADSPRAKNAGPVFSTTGRRDIEEARVPSFCVDELGVTVDSRAAAKFFDVPHVEITYRCATLASPDCVADRDKGDAFYRMGRIGFSRVVEGLTGAKTYLDAFDGVILELPFATATLLAKILAADRARLSAAGTDWDVTSAGRHDQSAIMAKAHRDFRAARRRGDKRPFGYWLAYSWRAAEDRRRGGN